MVHLLHHVLKPASDSPTLDHFHRNRWTNSPDYAELEQLLKNLRLRRVRDIYEDQVRAAEKEDVSYTEFVTRLVRAQWHARQEGALEWRIRRANLPERQDRTLLRAAA